MFDAVDASGAERKKKVTLKSARLGHTRLALNDTWYRTTSPQMREKAGSSTFEIKPHAREFIAGQVGQGDRRRRGQPDGEKQRNKGCFHQASIGKLARTA